jgi:hypothetical protein
MPRRLFVLRIPDGSIYAAFFLLPSITKQTSSTTKPHLFALGAQWLAPQFCPACPLLRWFWILSDRLECWPSSHEVSPPIWTFSAVDGSTTREHGSPSVRLYLFSSQIPVTKWCCLGSRACFRFRYHPTLPPCIHFCHRLHSSSVSVPPSKSTFMCMKSVFVFVNPPLHVVFTITVPTIPNTAHLALSDPNLAPAWRTLLDPPLDA